MRSLFFTAVVGVTYERMPSWIASRHGWYIVCSGAVRAVRVVRAIMDRVPSWIVHCVP